MTSPSRPVLCPSGRGQTCRCLCLSVSSHCLSSLVLQEQKCVPASGELCPELQEWSPYSPGHPSRHSNPPFYPGRASVGESLGLGRRVHGGLTGLSRPGGVQAVMSRGRCVSSALRSRELAMTTLWEVLNLLSGTFLSFSGHLPVAAWETGSHKVSSPILQMEKANSLHRSGAGWVLWGDRPYPAHF